MGEEDSIIRQIEEELKRERVLALFSRFKYWIIGGVASVLIVVVGGKFYLDAERERYDRFGLALLNAIEKKDEGSVTEALEGLDTLTAGSSRGYEALARFQKAALLSAGGQNSKARGIYVRLEKSAPSQNLRDLASLMWLYAALEVEEADALEERLTKLLRGGSIWRDSAAELEAFLAVRNGETERAVKLFTDLADDAQADGIRRRAKEMLILLVP